MYAYLRSSQPEMKKHWIILFTTCLLIAPCLKIRAQVDSTAVFVFLSETCPICQSISTELRELSEQFKTQPFGFLGVFPSSLSTETSRKQFADKYRLNFPFMADAQLTLTNRFDASTTPEVIVLNVTTGNIVYRGLIDNSFASVGRRRRVVTEHYLKDVLLAIQSQKPITLSSTKPVGCIIQK